MNTVKRRKLEHLGHKMRNYTTYNFLKTILQGKGLGEKRHGRKRLSWLLNLSSLGQ
jgi:hypothetical protein